MVRFDDVHALLKDDDPEGRARGFEFLVKDAAEHRGDVQELDRSVTEKGNFRYTIEYADGKLDELYVEQKDVAGGQHIMTQANMGVLPTDISRGEKNQTNYNMTHGDQYLKEKVLEHTRQFYQENNRDHLLKANSTYTENTPICIKHRP